MTQTDLARSIAEAYRWQRRLGNTQIALPYCHIVADPVHPNVWDANHADEVTAQTDAEIDFVLRAMDEHLAHTSWRVVHTDHFTPDTFLARLALDNFQERPPTIQMALHGNVTGTGCAIEMRPIADEADWEALLQLVLVDHAEGRSTSELSVSREVSAGLVAGYRSKSASYKFWLAMQHGQPVAYGAHAAAPNAAGMIEDLFTLQWARRRGIATAMIKVFTDNLRKASCHTIFLGALADEDAKRMYARLGFRPVMLARSWVKDFSDNNSNG